MHYEVQGDAARRSDFVFGPPLLYGLLPYRIMEVFRSYGKKIDIPCNLPDSRRILKQIEELFGGIDTAVFYKQF